MVCCKTRVRWVWETRKRATVDGDHWGGERTYSKLGGWISGGSIGFGRILYTCLVLYKRDGFFWGSLNPEIIPYAHIHNHIYTYVHIYTVLHTRINKHVHIIGLHTSLGEYLYFHVSCSLLAAIHICPRIDSPHSLRLNPNMLTDSLARWPQNFHTSSNWRKIEGVLQCCI